MARSNPDLHRLPRTPLRRLPRMVATAATALLLALPAASGAQNLLQSDLPISLEADSSDYDRRNDVVVFRGLTIVQGDMRIDADHARANRIDFDDAAWEFTGNVRVVLRDAVLHAEDAQLQFRGHRLVHAEAHGEPTLFEDRGSVSGQHIRGRARELQYDLEAGVIRLAGQAWLSEGANEISGASLIYNLVEERVLAERDVEERVRITINPRGESDDNDSGP